MIKLTWHLFGINVHRIAYINFNFNVSILQCIPHKNSGIQQVVYLYDSQKFWVYSCVKYGDYLCHNSHWTLFTPKMPLINQYSPGIPQVNVLVHAVNALTSESGFGQFIKHLEAASCKVWKLFYQQYKIQKTNLSSIP